MKYIKLLILLCLFFLTGCKKGEETIFKQINIDEVFDISDETYLVLFTGSNDTSLQVQAKIKEYCESTNKYKKAYNVYNVIYNNIDTHTVANECTKSEQLRFKNLPALIKISTKNSVKQSKLISDETNTIIDTINGLQESFEIDYDLDKGAFLTTLDNRFNESYEYKLQVPVKEGYTFTGFYEDNKLITKLENKNYKLKATWKIKEDYSYIKDDEIFNQYEDEYLVYLMKDNCPYCEKLTPNILSYLHLRNQKNALPLYVVNLNTSDYKSKIFRKYTQDGADGIDKDSLINGITSYDELYISGTPTLIKISKVEGVKEAFYVASGRTNVANKLLDYLNHSDSKINIKINLNDTSKTYVFYEHEEIQLPFIKTSDKTFIGYKENEKLVDNFCRKDYILSPIYIEYEYINEKDIFSYNDDYLVYFKSFNDNTNNSDVLKYVYKTTLEEYKYSKKLYIVNVNYDDVIYSSYDDLNDLTVNGAKKYEDLKIKSLPCLIEIRNKTSRLLAKGDSEVKNVLDNLLIKENKTFEEVTITFDITEEITYLGNKVNSIDKVTTYKFAQYSNLPVITKEGYTFLGWYNGDEKVVKVLGEDVTLKPRWIDTNNYSTIKDSDIFNQKETHYLVYFMKNGCTYCTQTESSVLEYASLRSTSKYQNSPKIYIVNLNDGKTRSKILREYKDGDSDTFVDGVTTWDELYIPKTPTLIEVKGEKGVSSLLAIGMTNIINTLNDKLTDTKKEIPNKKEYVINIDNDGILTKVNFYNGKEVILDEMKKDGYVFIGYEENGKLVTTFEQRDYNLKTVFKTFDDVQTLDYKEIFSLNGSYDILFLSENTQRKEALLKEVLLSQYKYNKDIYVVYIDETNILRAYNNGEGYNNKFYVTKAKSYDELYIYVTASIIRINKDGDNTYLASHYTQCVNYISSINK